MVRTFWGDSIVKWPGSERWLDHFAWMASFVHVMKIFISASFPYMGFPGYIVCHLKLLLAMFISRSLLYCIAHFNLTQIFSWKILLLSAESLLSHWTSLLFACSTSSQPRKPGTGSRVLKKRCLDAFQELVGRNNLLTLLLSILIRFYTTLFYSVR